jgi:regulator of protease activity HflC (stomatin/prohibitin superfamily)
MHGTDQDTLTYGRATTAAVVGLVIQILLSLAFGMVAVWSQSPAIYAATWHCVGGLPIWIVLAIIYQQHRLERVESLAAEKLSAQDATSAAIFGDVSDELQLARSRLDRLYRYALPAVSFFVAIYLIASGSSLLYSSRGLSLTDVSQSAAIAATCNPVGLMFATAGIAFVAFIAARWVSGYTRVRAWQLLRGGASYLMSTFVVAALLFVGAAVASGLDETKFFLWLAIAVPVLMVLVGTEILVTSMLAAYRPRRPGEIPRPAFDSRVLGLFTAPESLGQVIGELINYQFGVEVSGSWFYQLLGRAVTPLTVFAGLVLLGLSSLVIVGPDEQGVVLRFGALAREAIGPGMHVKLPWPIDTALVYPTGKVLQITVSSDRLGNRPVQDGLLWTGGDDNAAKMGLEYFLCASEVDTTSTNSMSLLVADVIVQYRVGDLVKFLRGSVSPREAIEFVTQQEAGGYFASKTLDYLLSRGRIEGGPDLQQRIQSRLDLLGIGLTVVDVSITRLQPPPGKVARAFHRQIGAQQSQETLVQDAKKKAIVTLVKVAGSVDRSRRINDAILDLDEMRTERADESQGRGGSTVATQPTDRDRQIVQKELEIESLLGEARGEAAERILAARAYRWTRVVGEQSSGERFAGQLMAYRAAPSYYMARNYLDILSAGLADRRKVIIGGQNTGLGTLPMLDLDFSDPTAALDTLLAE